MGASRLGRPPTAGSQRPTGLLVRLPVPEAGYCSRSADKSSCVLLGGRETVDRTVLICESRVVPCHATLRTR